MSKKISVLTSILIVTHAPGMLRAEVSSTTADFICDEVDNGRDSEIKEEMSRARQLAKAGHKLEARQIADETILEFEKLLDSSKTQLFFRSSKECIQYISTNGITERFQWIGSGYMEAFQLKAFLFAKDHNYSESLEILEKIINIAPTSANVEFERGYVLHQMGRSAEALEAYQEALRLSREYESQKVLEAAVLRSIGHVLIDLGKLDDAESSLRKSLELDPTNRGAMGQLLYIDQLRWKEFMERKPDEK
jgi:tetratricopeptide (TPR) repeat protein